MNNIRPLKTVWHRALQKLRYDPTGWREFPRVIQIDTNNHCGYQYCGLLCSYCYPQWIIQQGKRQYMELPMHHIEWILRECRRDGQKLHSIDLFLNGDGLTEPRLPDILAMSKHYLPHISTQTFTNGVLTDHVNRVLDRNLDSICFTISGHTPELWSRVHHGPPQLFSNVLATLNHVVEHRYSMQHVEVHCVVTNHNAPYIKDWWHTFQPYADQGVRRVLSPCVASTDNLPSQLASSHVTQRDVEQQIMELAGVKGRMWTVDTIPYPDPCVLWHNCSFDVEGFFLQCCNWSDPYQWNYGTIQTFMDEDRRLQDVWKERLANRMRNPICRSCNMKTPDWQYRLNQMQVNVHA